MNHIKELENKTIFVLRETYLRCKDTVFLWSMGKDSTALLWMIRKAFLGNIPFPIMHIDTGYKMPEIIRFRDRMHLEWNLPLIIHRNEAAIAEKMNPGLGKSVCCGALKTKALHEALEKNNFKTIIVGIRRDEEGTRAKERYFSPRYSGKWDYANQAPEIWGSFETHFAESNQLRVHPILHWNELDIWEYTRQENIPCVQEYFAKNSERYRSLGCAPCTQPIRSQAQNLDEIIHELKNTEIGEREGRAQDRESLYAMQRLREEGYM